MAEGTGLHLLAEEVCDPVSLLRIVSGVAPGPSNAPSTAICLFLRILQVNQSENQQIEEDSCHSLGWTLP